MTHRGPFQPLPFCDSVILLIDFAEQNVTFLKEQIVLEETVFFKALSFLLVVEL